MVVYESAQITQQHNMSIPWLHCNNCFFQVDKSVRGFYLTDCSHIYCEKCVTACTKEKCKMCRTQCSTLPLSGKIPKQVEEMFRDPKDLLTKFYKQFTQHFEFQRCHEKRLFRNLKQKVKCFEEQLKQVQGVMSQANNMHRELVKTKKENEYLKTLISKKDTHPRGSRTGAPPGAHGTRVISPGPYGTRGVSPGQPYTASPGVSPYSRPRSNAALATLSAQHTGSSGYSSCSPGSGYNILNQPGRLLVRSPPAEGKLGSVRDFNLTPESVGRPSQVTPLTVPRPIHFSNNS